MSNEFQHKSVGSQLSKSEYEHTDGTGHKFDNQATGDILYASSSTVLSKLAIGGTGAVLTVTGGIPAWDTTWTPTGHLIPATDDSYDLGSASAAWQDLFLEGDITLTDAGTLSTSAGALTITSAAAATWSTSAGALTINGTAGINLQEGGSTIIGISDARVISVGADDAGFDVIFYGDTASANMTWDTSVDDLILNGAARIVVPDGQLVLGSTAVSSTAAELNLLDGVSGLVQADFTKLAAVDATSTELNLMDGGSSIGTTTVSDGHGIVMNHGGTMAQTTVQTLAAYLDDEITAMPNLTSVGTLTTLTIDNIIINGTNIGHTSDTDAIAIASDGVVTMNQIPVFSAGINVSGGSIAGTLSTASQTNITGVGTISTGTWQGTAIDGGYINDNIISGQAEITSGLAAADELLYSDAGTVKRIGLDTLATKLFSVASAGTVAQASDHMLFLDNGATGDVIVESIDDFLTAIAGSGVSVSSSQLTVAAGSDTVDMGDGFVMEDGDGTEVTITENKEVKFVEGNGIDINWTDTDNGTDGDPYDLTFTVDHDAATNFVAAEHYDWSSDISGTATIHANNVTDLHGAGVSGSNNQLLTDDGDGTVTSESNLTFDGSTLTVTGDLTPSGTITVADGKDVHLTSTQTNNNYSGVTATFSNATGSTISKGKAVYISGDNQIALARANADNTMPAIGIAIADIANSGTGKVLLSGFIHDSDILDCTIGGEMYVSEDTAGELTKTLPASSGDRVQVVGVGLHADKMFFNPSYDIVERA